VRQIDSKDLDALAKKLSDKPQSVNTLAKKLRCSREAVKRRLEAYQYLVKGFIKIKQAPVREGERGPMSVGYYV
jgi:DNA-binding Lrp family transcriptional regulator